MKNYDFLNELNDYSSKILEKQNIILICVTGLSGVGKSTFGKYVRKNGFGNFKKNKITVIDDSVMSINKFFIFNQRIKIKTKIIDELKPFIALLPKIKKIIFYINTTPYNRITQADIILNLCLNEKERINRLMLRDKNICDRHFIDENEKIKNINHKYYLEKKVY